MITRRSVSKSELKRQKGESQIASRRTSILDTAERLFLEQGLEHTTMADIARGEAITTVTLYRYFPGRDPISFEIAARKMKQIASSLRVDGGALTVATVRQIALGLIDRFPELVDAYRYMGMFDHLYGDRYPDETLAVWYKDMIFSLEWGGVSLRKGGTAPVLRERVIVTLNTVLCFLEKMAARGELLSKEQGISLDAQLRHFREMIAVYLDRLE